MDTYINRYIKYFKLKICDEKPLKMIFKRILDVEYLNCITIQDYIPYIIKYLILKNIEL